MTKQALAFSFGVAVLAVFAAAAAPAQELADELKEKTVMITVQFSNGQQEQGAGVVLCQQADKVWILTANHVFAGKSEKAWQHVRPTQIESATISFYRNSAAPFVADSASLSGQADFFHSFEPEDLLLLAVPLTERLPSTATLASPPSEGHEQTVVTFGYPANRGASWEQAGGELVSGTTAKSKFLYHTAEVHEGFSGGPLFNAAGALIGINVQRVKGEQTPGGKTGEWYGMAQAVDHQDVLAALDEWMPARCLKSAGAVSGLAYITYRKAMQAVSTRRWKEAEDLMSQAVVQQPLEGGSVHLEGMRYTRYLPLYHLGLANFKLENYSDAIRQWERSEAQGEIQQDKRYEKLKRLRERAYKAQRRKAAMENKS